jgi:poly(A) polymerase
LDSESRSPSPASEQERRLPRRRRRRGRRRPEAEDRGLPGRGEQGLDHPDEAEHEARTRPRPDGPQPTVVSAERIAPERIDSDALRVVSRLQRRGFEAYLVGGCVRDLLLGIEPKDFDVATAAHPRQVKRLFRNGRIIGRRFKLVHVVYGDHVVETATFRADPNDGGPRPDPDSDDLLIIDDNEFGTAAEDARRRDFTINALFLDPLENRILDYVGGLEDLERRTLRTIGDPRVRMAEDPVRILRAIKFATRLGLSIDAETDAAMCELAGELERAAPARLVEELVRLLRSGHAGPVFRELDRVGALPVLVPQVARWLESSRARDDDAGTLFKLLDGLDQRTRRQGAPSLGLCLAALYALPAHAALERLDGEHPPTEGRLQSIVGDLLFELGTASRLSRRDLSHARRLLVDQRRFHQTSSKRFRPLLFMRGPEFPETLELFHLTVEARDDHWELLERWQQRYEQALEVEPEELEVARATRRRRRRRRSKRGSAPAE